MSTRSGKRIHASFHDYQFEEEEDLQNELKPRSKKQKKQKENIEVCIKRRSNYVSYPADEDIIINSAKMETQVKKSGRQTRRNTLKDFNVDVLISDSNHTNGNSNVRETRRTKKLQTIEGAAEVENIKNEEEPEMKPVANGKKKSNKKIVRKKISGDQQGMTPQDALKKKGSKKKKRSTSIIIKEQERDENGEEVNGTGKFNKSNISEDSFHSASNCPDQGNLSEDNDETDIKSNNRTIDDMKAAGSSKDSGYAEHECRVSDVVNSKDTRDSGQLYSTFNRIDEAPTDLNTTVSKETRKRRKFGIKKFNDDANVNITKIIETKDLNNTFDVEENKQNSTFDKDIPSTKSAPQSCQNTSDSVKNLDSFLEKNSKGTVSATKSLDTTFDKDTNEDLNTTFDKEKKYSEDSDNDLKKSSLISSDATINLTYDKSNENSSVSVTSDESKPDNILNLTPMLIESSIDESVMSGNKKTPEKYPTIPLKREGTFTKDSPDIIMSPKPKVSADHTPAKRNSLPSPGCTPFPLSRRSQKEKSMMNVTRSIEKKVDRRSSLADLGPTTTRVMFCSPVSTPAVVMQVKGKVIKSSLKGSNKSFVFDNSVSSEKEVREVREGRAACGRKRSLTLGEAEARAKRRRLAAGQQRSVDRLARPRTQSAAAKLADRGSPARAQAQARGQAEEAREAGAGRAARLPDFAALHQRQFARMESLGECQARRARRARLLLTPPARPGAAGTPPQTATPPSGSVGKSRTPSKPKPPALAAEPTSNPGYTRFGFKLNTDVNPFSFTATKAEGRRAEESKEGRSVRPALPARAGRTPGRRAPQREQLRQHSRTVIRGVRTNRRFELQMQMRNMNV